MRVGRIARTHGLAGEVSVVQTTALDLSTLVGSTVWFVPPAAGPGNAVVESVRQGPKGPLLLFRGIDTAATAASLRGLDVAIPAGSLPEGLEDLAFDPVGLTVVDQTRGPLGRVTEVIETGANDVWVVDEGPHGRVLLPVIDEVIVDLDEETDTVIVRLLPGLLEEE